MVLKMTPKPDTQISFPRVGLMGGSASGLVQLWLNQQPWSRTQFLGFQPPRAPSHRKPGPWTAGPTEEDGGPEEAKDKGI